MDRTSLSKGPGVVLLYMHATQWWQHEFLSMRTRLQLSHRICTLRILFLLQVHNILIAFLVIRHSRK